MMGIGKSFGQIHCQRVLGYDDREEGCERFTKFRWSVVQKYRPAALHQLAKAALKKLALRCPGGGGWRAGRERARLLQGRRAHRAGGGLVDDAHHGGEGAAAQRAPATRRPRRPQLLRAGAAESAAHK